MNNTIITNEERENLYNDIISLLDEYDYSYTKDAIITIIETWAENKKDLIYAFKKHENYINGQFMIAFNTDYMREIDRSELLNFDNYLWEMGRKYRKDLPDNLLEEVERERLTLPEKMYDFIHNILCRYAERTINETIVSACKRAFPDLPVHNGEKTTRLMNRICTYLKYTQDADYNRKFARYADALTPITIKRHTILSIHPCDYLTMSFGNSWSSCHTIDKHNKRHMPNGYNGMYSSGTMSYMLDETSMVFYTTDEKNTNHEYFTQEKINRQMFHFNGDLLLQSRLYPQSNDGANDIYTPFRNLVQEIIANIFDFPNLWTVKSDNIGGYTQSFGTHYRDYTCFNSCRLSIRKGAKNPKKLEIGHAPICIECGKEHDIADNINCCKSGYICADCGCRIECEDDCYYVDGECYCSECVTYCEYCNEYVRNEDIQEVHNGRYTKMVCNHCLENSEYYFFCEDCNEWYCVDDGLTVYCRGYLHLVCRECAESGYTLCEDCYEYYADDEVEEIDGCYYCENCAEEHREDVEDEQ